MYRYLALGDSYTCGEDVPPAQNFPNQLATQLRSRGVDIADPTIVAVTGWTTDELGAGIADAKLAEHYDLVTLLIGVNNQYRGTAKGYTLQTYQAEFAQLLQQAIDYADNPSRVIVLSIPDWGAMPFAEGMDRAAIGADIDAYNAINRQEAAAQGVGYLDLTALTRREMADPAFATTDGLHPTSPVYTLWTTDLLPLAQQALQAKP